MSLKENLRRAKAERAAQAAVNPPPVIQTAPQTTRESHPGITVNQTDPNVQLKSPYQIPPPDNAHVDPNHEGSAYGYINQTPDGPEAAPPPGH